MFRILRRRTAICVAILAAAAFAGGAIAATQEQPINARQAFLSDVAQRLHVSTKQLQSAITGADVDQLNRAVASGRLSAAQASRMRTFIERGGALPLGGLLGPQAVRPAFALPFGGPRIAVRVGPGAWGLPPRAAGLPPAAIAVAPGAIGALFGDLGVTPAQLFSGMRAGKTLAQIATEHGKTLADLEHAIIASRTAMLDKLVAAKLITRASAATRLARLERRLTTLLTTKHPLAALLRPRFAFGFQKAHSAVP